MPNFEKQLGVVRDIILPVDIRMRYDIYFTDRRVAIVCMGRANRFESEAPGPVSFMPSAFGVPPLVKSYVEPVQKEQTIDQETKNWSVDNLLKLSKKSCFYTHDEIEEIKLVLGHKPKFIILSKECESKFDPSAEQLKQLSEMLPSIETLRNKISIAGSWDTLYEIFRAQFSKEMRDSSTLNNKQQDSA